MDSCGIFEKYDLQNCLLKEYQYWYLLVRKRQSYLGSCVVILKRHAFPMSQLTPAEISEYLTLTQQIESSLQKSFGSKFCQHLSVMYVDSHIHFLITPRYDHDINFNNKTWVDDQTPDPLINKVPDSSLEEVNLIKEKLLNNLKI